MEASAALSVSWLSLRVQWKPVQLALSEGMGERVMDDKHTPGAPAAHGREAGPPIREEIIAAKRPPPERKKTRTHLPKHRPGFP